MSDRSVKVVLTAQVAGYIAGMEQAAKATRDTGSETEKLGQQQQAFERMGRAAMLGGATVAVGLGIASKAAIDWDSAWAGVTKTVDGTPEQLAAVEDGLRGLAKVLPASHTEIAAVAEAAGQLGIATPNVVEFTKTMIDLGETTNLTAQDAATQLARFVNVMGTSQGQVANLGSALVELGNNYATTEAEILSMAQRLSGAGVQIGMSEGQVLGLSTALSSVGIEAEAGGSAMSKVMIDIASSVDKGGERLGQFAEVSGMSAQAFAAQWRNDPGEALASFVKGLANAEAQGKSTFGVLEDLGISEVRMRDALLRSASAADQFSAAMATGNKAFGENTALVDEANKRYDTVASKLAVMRNQVTDAAISIGDHLLPLIGGAAEGIGSLADSLAGLDGPMGAVVAWGGLVAAGVLLTGGAALAAVPKIAAYKIALETLGVTTADLKRGFAGLRGVLGPVGVAATLTGVAIQSYEAAARSGEKSTAELKSALSNAKSEFDALTLSVKDQSTVSKVFIGSMADGIKDLAGVLEENSSKTGLWKWLTQDFQDKGIIDRISDIGVALAEIGATDFSAAQQSFRDLREEYKLSDESASQMIQAMPAFRDQLLEQADAAGLATDENSLLRLAMQEIGPAANDGAESFDELGGVVSETQEAIAALADEIRGFNDPIFDMREANRQLEESFVSLSDSLANNGNNFDISSEAGRKNEAALDAVAEATNRAAANVYEATGEQEAMNAKLDEGRQKLIDILAPYFDTRDAAAAYVDQLNLISPEKVTKFIADTDDAQSRVAAYVQALGAVSPVVGTVLQITERVTRQLTDANADGGLYAYADGGIAAYADGGFASGIYKGGTPIHKFAEPETIWEAYISGKPDQRDRNRQIWLETGDRLGVLSALREVFADAGGVGAAGPLIGSLQFVSSGDLRSDVGTVTHELRKLRRGGRYVGA